MRTSRSRASAASPSSPTPSARYIPTSSASARKPVLSPACDARDALRHGPAVIPSASPSAFDYDEAFSRNLGWVTEAEQQRLRRARVCIAGLGGVGGIYLLTLARLGIGAFSVADFDRFS